MDRNAINSKFNRSVSLLSWAYNEEESIRDYLERASALMDASVEDYEIVLIDDGSTDRTFEIAQELQKKNQRIKIFKNERNLNVGISSIRAIQRAKKEFLFWQTVDWCYDISRLREHLEHLKKYDVVQGVRRKPVEVKASFVKPFLALLQLFGIKHLTKRSDTVPKAFVSIINYMLIRLLFWVPLSDFQNITFYRTRWIQSIRPEADSAFANPEWLIKSYWNGMSIKEVPIGFIPRQKGKAKGTCPKILMRSVKDVFKLWFIWVILGKRGRIRKGTICRLDSKELE